MARTSISSERWLAALFLIAVAGVAGWSALSGTPADELSLVPCPVVTMTGVACPGCGMTRACVSLAQGELAGAWGYHPFAFFLVPLALLVAFLPGRTRAAWARVPRGVRQSALASLLAACVAVWITRLG